MEMESSLITRVAKYPRTYGYVGATGCWHYTQIEKDLVSNPDDIEFFNSHQTKMSQSGWFGKNVCWEGRWTFDGTDRASLNNIKEWSGGRHTLSPIGQDDDGNFIYENPWEGGKFKVRESEIGDSVSHSAVSSVEYLQVLGSTYSPTYLYGTSRIPIGGNDGAFTPPFKAKDLIAEYGTVNCDDVSKIRWVEADYMVFDDCQYPTPTSTGIMFWSDSIPAPSSINITFSESPFSYLEMCGT